jgi:peptidoglycan hydrolase-like protein with peptidoglycan-binding domain
MTKWTSALTLTVAAAMVATTAFAQSSNKPASSPSTSPSMDKPSSAPSASPGTSTTDPAKSTSDSMKSDSMKSDSMKAEKMSKPAAGGNREQVKAVQQALKDKGHDPGTVDGVMGPKTRGALKDFQKKEGMKDTGRIDQETMTKLGVEAKTSSTSPAPGSASPSTSSPSTSPSTSPSASPSTSPSVSPSTSPSGSSATDTKSEPSTTEKK